MGLVIVFDTIKLLQQLPDSPGIVVMSAKEDPEERAQFLAAGCEAVLYSGLSKASLQDVLNTILTKRSAFQLKTLTTLRKLAQPRLTDFVSTSTAMQSFMRVATRVVKAEIPLLLLGAPGKCNDPFLLLCGLYLCVLVGFDKFCDGFHLVQGDHRLGVVGVLPDVSKGFLAYVLFAFVTCVI